MCENQRSMGEIRTGPRERLVFLDLARGLAIVFMVLQHAVLLFATGQGEGSVLGKIVLLLGGAPAAPVFLFIMGIFLGRPDRKIGRGVRRGLKLIALGYLLNLLRSTLPSLFTGPEIASATVPASPLASFWAVDILQMAGLSFVLLTLLRRYLPFRWVWAILAAAVAFVSPLLWHWGGPSGVYALWGNRDDVFFPLFPWVVYPLAGMVYGPCSFEAEDRGRAVKRRAVIGTLFFAVGGATFFLPRMGGDSTSGSTVGVVPRHSLPLWASFWSGCPSADSWRDAGPIRPSCDCWASGVATSLPSISCSGFYSAGRSWSSAVIAMGAPWQWVWPPGCCLLPMWWSKHLLRVREEGRTRLTAAQGEVP